MAEFLVVQDDETGRLHDFDGLHRLWSVDFHAATPDTTYSSWP
jgi:hypothetical protein